MEKFMKALAINGSPRAGGNTEILLNAVLEPLRAEGIETKLIQVGGKNIHGCRGCGTCLRVQNRKCVSDEDILNSLLEDIYAADALILGTPSYYSAMTPELKSLIDRAGFVAGANGSLMKRKIGAAVVAQRRGGGSAVQSSIHEMFLITQMIIVGSTYWNFAFGLEKGEVLNDEEGMANMKNLGENIAWTLKKLHA